METQETYTTKPNIFMRSSFQNLFHNKLDRDITNYYFTVRIPTVKQSLYRDFTEIEREEVSTVQEDMPNNTVHFNYVLDEFFVSLVEGSLINWISLFSGNIEKSYLFDEVRNNAVDLFGTGFIEGLLWMRDYTEEAEYATALGCYKNAVVLEVLKAFHITGKFDITPFNNTHMWQAYQRSHLTKNDYYGEINRIGEDIDGELNQIKNEGLFKPHDNKKIHEYVYKIFCNANRIEL